MLEVKKVLDYKKPIYENEDKRNIYAYENCYNCFNYVPDPWVDDPCWFGLG